MRDLIVSAIFILLQVGHNNLFLNEVKVIGC